MDRGFWRSCNCNSCGEQLTMENRTGRLDLLLLGIVERIASRNPLAQAAFRAFEQDLREMFRPLDCPEVRKFVRKAAPGSVRKKRTPKLGVRLAKRLPANKPVQVVEAEWVS